MAGKNLTFNGYYSRTNAGWVRRVVGRRKMVAHIYIVAKDMPKQEVPGALDSSFSVSDGMMSLYWKDKAIIGALSVKVGDVVYMDCGRGLPIASKLKAPARNQDVLPWLFGFSFKSRTNSSKRFPKLWDMQRERYKWSDYHEQIVIGEGYTFVRCNHPSREHINMAAYVDGRRKIDKPFIMEVLTEWGDRGIVYPRPYVERLLMQRFGFSFSDLDELEIRNPELWH